MIGRDGHQLLAAIYATDAPAFLAQIPAVETLRQVWVQRYWIDDLGQVNQRTPADSPSHQQLTNS